MTCDYKRCTECKKDFPATPKFFFRQNVRYLKSKCRICVTALRRKNGRYHAAHSKRDRVRVIERMFWWGRDHRLGVTRADYECACAFQDHKCALCRTKLPERDCVDHDHKTGLVRGILCYGCNTHFEREGSSASKLTLVRRYLSRPYVWELALAVCAPRPPENPAQKSG